MPNVTQKTENPGRYEDNFNAIKKQMLKNDKTAKKYSDKELEVIIKNALIEKAEDKLEFSLRGEVRRGRHIKMGMDEEAFSKLWKSKMKQRLEADGFPFSLTAEEKKVLADCQERMQKEKAEEIAKITSEAMRKILLNA